MIFFRHQTVCDHRVSHQELLKVLSAQRAQNRARKGESQLEKRPCRLVESITLSHDEAYSLLFFFSTHIYLYFDNTVS